MCVGNGFKTLLILLLVFFNTIINVESKTVSEAQDNVRESVEKDKDNGSIEYSASRVSHSDLNDYTHVLDGDVQIKSKGITINADRILIDTKNNIVSSFYDKDDKKKNKRIKIVNKNGDIIYCSSIKYNLNSSVGLARNVLLYKNNAIILARIAKIDYDGTFYCSDVSLTSCKKEKPDWAVILDNAIVFKNSLFYLYGAKIMLSGTYFPFISGVGLPYLLAENNKSGLKYPESINFGSYGGLAIKNFGFYIYFNKYRDLNCNISAFLGDSSVNVSLIHNYIKQDSYQGAVALSLNKVSAYKMVFGYEEEFNTSWEFVWKHSTLSYKNYEFTSDISLSNSYSDVESSKGNKNLNVDMSFKIKNILNFFTTDIMIKYNKNTENKLEDLKIPHIELKSKEITFLKYLSIEPSIDLVTYISNKKKDIYVRDEHDIELKDDIIGTDEIFNKKNIINFFKNMSCSRIKNMINKISFEGKLEFPLQFRYKIFNLMVDYSNRVFFSRYNVNTGNVEIRKFPYYVHSCSASLGLSINLVSPKLTFNELKSSNILKIKELVYNKDIDIDVRFNPSSEKMQSIFKLDNSYYSTGDKTIDLFSHTFFGNLKNRESLTLNIKNVNYITLTRKPNENDIKYKILSIAYEVGYDFLKDKCRLNDIKTTFNINIWRVNVNVNCSVYPYQYSDILIDNRRDKVDKWFFQDKSSFFKSFLDSVMSFSVDTNVKLVDNSMKKEEGQQKNMTNNIINKNLLLETDKEYEKLYIWENLKINVKYTFGYKYNPIIRASNINHLISLYLSTLLSKKCDISLSSVFDIKDKFIKSLTLNGKYDLHCWLIKFDLSVNTDAEKDRNFKYNISISPKVEIFNFLSQTRESTLEVYS